MAMNDKKYLLGKSEVYNNSEIKDFEEAESYPLLWEVIFINDQVGKEFTIELLEQFENFPKEKGRINLEGNHTDKLRSAECDFKNVDCFRQILNPLMDKFSILDEKTNQLMPKQTILNNAQEMITQKLVIV